MLTASVWRGGRSNLFISSGTATGNQLQALQNFGSAATETEDCPLSSDFFHVARCSFVLFRTLSLPHALFPVSDCCSISFQYCDPTYQQYTVGGFCSIATENLHFIFNSMNMCCATSSLLFTSLCKSHVLVYSC
jgi:hypothetical protein